jgi:hypothetical protein
MGVDQLVTGGDVDNPVVESLTSNSVNTDKETINHGMSRGRDGERVDASKYDGQTADDRLANAISAASDYDTIYLEKATYTQNIDTGTRLILVGTGIEGGTTIDADWSFNSPFILKYADISGSISINAFRAKITYCGGSGSISDAGGLNIYSLLVGLSITFGSSTSNSIVDASTQLSVTDNGSNTVGDIA